MNKREIAKWRKAIDDAEQKYRKAMWGGEDNDGLLDEDGEDAFSPNKCALRKAVHGNCKKCLYYCRFGCTCVPTVRIAIDKHSRRPIYDAIRKMRKYLDEQEAGKR